MMNNNDTLSVRTKGTLVALCAVSLTTTLNTSAMTYITPPKAIMGNVWDDNIGTTTITPKFVETKGKSNYDSAKELFDGEMRNFTKEEAKIYQESLKKIYKPIGVNIFDIC